MAVVNSSLVFVWPANGANCAIHKPKTVVKGSSSSLCGISIRLKGGRIKQLVIPLRDLMAVGLINVINNLVGYHAEYWNRSFKAVYHRCNGRGNLFVLKAYIGLRYRQQQFSVDI